VTRRMRRNPVLAPITRWMWWSPWHLIAVCLALIVTGALLSAALRTHHSPRPPAAAVTPSSTAPTSPSVPATSASSAPPTSSALPSVAPSSSSAAPVAARDQAKAAAAAVAWVRLWARPRLAARTWLASLQPLTYVEYLNVLASVRPATVPATAVGGRARMERFAPGAAHVRVPVVGGTVKQVDVTVIFQPMSPTGRWLVSGVEPA
jgi:hypothetical protein